MPRVTCPSFFSVLIDICPNWEELICSKAANSKNLILFSFIYSGLGKAVIWGQYVCLAELDIPWSRISLTQDLGRKLSGKRKMSQIHLAAVVQQILHLALAVIMQMFSSPCVCLFSIISQSISGQGRKDVNRLILWNGSNYKKCTYHIAVYWNLMHRVINWLQ